MSFTLPAVRMKRTGLPSPSTLTLISGRRANARSPDLRSPFCTGRVLMRPLDGGVDDQVLKVRVFDQRVENTRPNALLGPPTEACENTVPFAKLVRKVAPWRS